MQKSPPFLSLFLIPLAAAALAAPSCAGGETAPGGGTGNTSGSGGAGSPGSGGRIGGGAGGSSFSSGGSTGTGSGGASTGSGGSTGTGSGGASFGSGGASFGSGGSTGAGGTPVSTGALTVVDGYGMSGSWKGYGYTFTGPATGSKATITPATFMAMTSLCSNGSIMADTTYASVAGMGWNINQAVATTATAPPIETTASSGTGLAITVSVTGLTLVTGGGLQLRAQVKTAAGDFCAPLAASGLQMVPWAMFNSKCWNTAETGAAAFVAGTPIKAVELVIPSGTAAVGPFTGLCLMDAKPY